MGIRKVEFQLHWILTCSPVLEFHFFYLALPKKKHPHGYAYFRFKHQHFYLKPGDWEWIDKCIWLALDVLSGEI